MATIKYQIGNTVYSCLNVGDVTGRYIAIQAPGGSPEIIPLFSGGSGSVVEHGGYKYTLGHLCVNGLRPAISRVRSSVATFNIRYCINSTHKALNQASWQRTYGFIISTISGETPSSVQLCSLGGGEVYMTFPADGNIHWFRKIHELGSSPFTLIFNFSGKSVQVHFDGSGNKPFLALGIITKPETALQMQHSYYMTLEITESGANVLSLSQV